MKRQLRALAAAGLLVASSLVAVALGGSASADTQICEQYGSTTIQGRYVVQNNRWGTTAQQCINVTGTGFAITTQQGSRPHQRRAGVVPVGLLRLPLHQLLARHQPADAGQPDQQRDQQHHLQLRQRRHLQRLVRHLAGPDAQAGRREPDGDHDLVQPAGLDPADRLVGRQRQPSAAAPGRCGGATTAPTTSSRTSRRRRSPAGTSACWTSSPTSATAARSPTPGT